MLVTHALPVKDLQRNRQPRENNTSVLDVLEGTEGEGEEKTRAVAGERVKPRHATPGAGLRPRTDLIVHVCRLV